MAATNRLSLLIESQTRGTNEVDKLTQALNRVTDTAERSSKRTAKAGDQATASITSISGKLQSAIQNPMGAATGAIDKFTSSLGTAGLVVGGFTLGLGAIVGGSFAFMKQMGEMSDAMGDFSDRTGLTVDQVDRLMGQAKIAGINIGVLERSAGRLAEALEGGGVGAKRVGDALKDLGVETRTATGQQREMGPVILDVIERMSRLGSQVEQAAKANTILGISGKELLPLIRSYQELEQRADRLGLGKDGALIAAIDETRKSMVELGISWDLLKRKLAVPAKAIVDLALGATNISTSGVPSLIGGATRIDTRTAGQKLPDITRDLIARQMNITAGNAYVLAEDRAAQVRAAAATAEAMKRAAEYANLVASGIFAASQASANLPLNAALQRGPYTGFRSLMPSIGVGGVEYPRVSPGAQSVYISPEATAGIVPGLRMRQIGRIDENLRIEQQLISLTRQNASTIERMAALRTKAAYDEYAITKNRGALDDRLYSIRREQETSLFELQLRQQEELAAKREQAAYQYRDAVVSAFDSLVARGGGFGTFLQAQGLGIGRQIAGNFAGATYSAVAGRLTLPGQGTAEKPSFLGKLLSGTPLGLDPLKTATDMNTVATIQNTVALRAATTGTSIGGAVQGLSGLMTSGFSTGNPSYIDYLNQQQINAPLAIPPPGGSGLSALQGIGIAGAGAAGAFGIYSGIKQGGARGALTASGSGLGAAGAILSLAGVTGPPASILLGAGLGLGLVTSLLGDPKEQRREEMQLRIDSARIEIAGPTTIQMTGTGRGFDYNVAGGMRTINEDQIADAVYNASQRGHKVNAALREAVLR